MGRQRPNTRNNYVIFSAIQKKIIIVLVAFITGLSTIGYFYYKSSQRKIIEITKENTLLHTAHDNTLRTLASIQNDVRKISKINNELIHKRRILETEVNDLRKKFSRHDLGFLAVQKPKLVSRIINKATRKIGEEIEKLTSINNN